MSVAEAIRAGTERLSNTSETARLDAELLMAHALGVSRSDMLLRSMYDAAPATFADLIDRRATHEPVAYLVGAQEFYGRTFRVTPDVLIPRGDSESVVEFAMQAAPDAERVLDLGTGSGALFVTALLELSDASGVAIDASQPALHVAENNAQRHGLGRKQAQFKLADWRVEGWAEHLGTFDLILCNPPYVESDAMLDPDVRNYEPASALFAGKDGLDDYRVLIPQIGKLLNQGAVAVFEIGATQAASVSEIAEMAGFSVEIRKDLANRPRCAILR